ncbi:MAG: inhibitor of cysteine peptidase [Actinomycetota bacterium]|jgi:inhibitor of cysteine peptidase|nr:inhibitor of cysteine peptidase [Actinomycetota bacterium]
MDLSLDESAAGSTHRVRVGDTVSIRLAETPTTGYRWSLDVDQARLRVDQDEFRAAGDARGAGGERLVVITALAPGATTLRLAKSRSWTPGAVAEVVVDLDVAEQGA